MSIHKWYVMDKHLIAYAWGFNTRKEAREELARKTFNDDLVVMSYDDREDYWENYEVEED